MLTIRQFTFAAVAGSCIAVGCEPTVEQRNLGTILDEVPNIKPLPISNKAPAQPKPSAPPAGPQGEQPLPPNTEPPSTTGPPATKGPPAEKASPAVKGPPERAPIGPTEPPAGGS